MGYMAVAGGLANVVIAMGIEKMTDETGATVTSGLALAADGDYELPHGLSFVAINALLMQLFSVHTSFPESGAGQAIRPWSIYQKPLTPDYKHRRGCALACFRTVSDMDVAPEPTRTYSWRVLKQANAHHRRPVEFTSFKSKDQM